MTLYDLAQARDRAQSMIDNLMVMYPTAKPLGYQGDLVGRIKARRKTFPPVIVNGVTGETLVPPARAV